MDIEYRLRKYYGDKDKRPSPPNPALVELWTHLSTVANSFIQSLNVPLDIVCGNYLSDIKMLTWKISAFPKECILFNLRRLEFLIDFLEFTDHPDGLHFQHFFSKFMRDFYSAENREWWRFYEYLRIQSMSAMNRGRLEINLHKAFMADIFAIVHEVFHSEVKADDMRTVRRMIESEPFMGPYEAAHFSEVPDEKIPETSCDFWAFSLILHALFIQKDTAPYGIDEFFETALLDVMLNDLYCRMTRAGLQITTGEEFLIPETDEVKQLTERIQPLISMAKISSNTKMEFFDQIDFGKVIDGIGNRVNAFYTSFSQYCKRCEQLLDDYKKLPEEEKPSYPPEFSDGEKDTIWIYHTIKI